MDADSDHDADFQVGRRHTPSSSRDSSPAAKRQKHSFSPTSDDGDLVVPVAHSEDAETPTPENAPLIRQAVGFSWTPSINTSVSTYQATVAPPPAASYFLPGQAPPPKPKAPNPRRPRRKKDEQYSDQTSKFRLSGSPGSGSGSASLAPVFVGNSTGTSSSSGPGRSFAPSRPVAPPANHMFVHNNRYASAGPSNTNGATTGMVSPAPSQGTKRTKKPPKKNGPAAVNNHFSQPSPQQSPAQPSPFSTSVTRHHPTSGGSLAQRPVEIPDPRRASVASSSASVEHTNGSMDVTQGPAPGVPRPIRMVTLLIEDVRSGVPDSQLAEVKVPLRVADDPEDGFWADAVEICNALQGGPSRIDGPAKVYTMRGRFRQFFMRVDQFDQLQAQSAHIGVSKERTLSVFVEAPVPQGHLPRPPVLPPDVRPTHNSGSEHDAMSPVSAPASRPTYTVSTREDQIERLSKSNYARPERRRLTPVSESGSYGHSQRTTSPNARHKSSRHAHDQYAGQRSLTPPIPGRLADTQEEKDEAIANYIRSHIENHHGWIEYMQSQAKPQRVSEVLTQYTFVEDRARELIGRKTPSHWDGAPNCLVERQHVWRVLKLNAAWGEECQETLVLLGYYGKNGSRYEDSRIMEMINDTSPPKAHTMSRFLRFLRSVDESFAQEALSGQFMSRQD